MPWLLSRVQKDKRPRRQVERGRGKGMVRKVNELFLIAALSVAPVSFNRHADFTQADQTFFRFLRACCPEVKGDEIVVMSMPFDYLTLKMGMERLAPGGFLLIEIGEWLGFRLHLQMSHYELLPFYWRTYSVYRKPFGLGRMERPRGGNHESDVGKRVLASA